MPNLWEYESKEIEQYYLSNEPDIRVRRSDDEYTLTIKSKGSLKRDEIEIFIGKSQYEEIKGHIPLDNYISKTRYYIPYNEHICELDVYHNIKGLIVVEVEFESVEDADQFGVPSFFGEEITYIEEFKNRNLDQRGFPYKVKCYTCMGKGQFYDRDSMANYNCDTCHGSGDIEIDTINIEIYGKTIKESKE